MSLIVMPQFLAVLTGLVLLLGFVRRPFLGQRLSPKAAIKMCSLSPTQNGAAVRGRTSRTALSNCKTDHGLTYIERGKYV